MEPLMDFIVAVTVVYVVVVMILGMIYAWTREGEKNDGQEARDCASLRQSDVC